MGEIRFFINNTPDKDVTERGTSMNSYGIGEESFGEYLRSKREERHITLRGMAERLGISAPYLTDVERNRKNPPSIDKLEQIREVLDLTKEEYAYMMNLAGKSRNTVAPDLPGYIMDRDYVSAALRTARDMGAGKEEWDRFVAMLLEKDTKTDM